MYKFFIQVFEDYLVFNAYLLYIYYHIKTKFLCFNVNGFLIDKFQHLFNFYFRVPSHLLHKNSSFVINEMFKAAEQDLQIELWNTYIAEHLGKLVVHCVGNFVIQRLFDAIQDKNIVCIYVLFSSPSLLFYENNIHK